MNTTKITNINKEYLTPKNLTWTMNTTKITKNLHWQIHVNFDALLEIYQKRLLEKLKSQKLFEIVKHGVSDSLLFTYIYPTNSHRGGRQSPASKRIHPKTIRDEQNNLWVTKKHWTPNPTWKRNTTKITNNADSQINPTELNNSGAVLEINQECLHRRGGWDFTLYYSYMYSLTFS